MTPGQTQPQVLHVGVKEQLAGVRFIAWSVGNNIRHGGLANGAKLYFRALPRQERIGKFMLAKPFEIE